MSKNGRRKRARGRNSGRSPSRLSMSWILGERLKLESRLDKREKRGVNNRGCRSKLVGVSQKGKNVL